MCLTKGGSRICDPNPVSSRGSALDMVKINPDGNSFVKQTYT